MIVSQQSLILEKFKKKFQINVKTKRLLAIYIVDKMNNSIRQLVFGGGQQQYTASV